MKTIGIVGSRRRNTQQDYGAVKRAFTQVYEVGDRIVSGGCPKGADRFAEILARSYGATIIIHHAAWNRLGKKAGFARNTYIANDADILIACVSEDRKGGTEDTVRKFSAKGTPKDSLIIV